MVRALANLVKYNGTTNSSVWLEEYRLAYCIVGIKDDPLVIQFLPIHLTKGARVWLKHLSSNTIHDGVDLKKAFMGNF